MSTLRHPRSSDHNFDIQPSSDVELICLLFDKQKTFSQCSPTPLTKMQSEINETNTKLKLKILKTDHDIGRSSA